MANPKPGSRSAYYPQEYYSRIRYSNALPPPPCPPKFLNIPGTEYAADCYTSVAYTAKLAREQPLCIEVDSELGMPLDLIGIPGVFEDDWSALDMSYDQRNHHPTDLLLLRPIHALTGKNEVKPTNAAFLRRGEHIQVTSGASAKPRAAKKLSGRPPKDLDAARDVRVKSIQNWLGTYPDTPILDLMKEQHLLELGLSNRRGNQNPVHPSKPRSKLIGEYPIVPNLASITDTGGYYSLQINGATNDVHERYDEGLDVAIFRPMELSEIARAEYEAQQQSQGSNGIAPLEPGPEPLQYEMYKPANEETAPIIKKNFDLRSGDLTEDPSEIGGHSGDNRSLHSYLRKARFETDLQHTRVPGTQSLQEIVMVLQRAEDGTTSSQDLQSGSRSALWSRIIQHTSLNEIEGARALGEARSADVPQGADKIELVIREEDEKEKRLRRGALQELEHGTDGSG